MEHFIEKLENILQYYGLTASGFADLVGVQRSSLSHLLSGRNKPSLDFILKIIEAFPEVDLNWILLDQGTFPKSKNIPTPAVTISTENKEITEASKASNTENKSLQDKDLEFFKEGKQSQINTITPVSLEEAFPEETNKTNYIPVQYFEAEPSAVPVFTEVDSMQTTPTNSEILINKEVIDTFVSTNITNQSTSTILSEEKTEKQIPNEKVLENSESKNPLVQALLQKDAIEMIAVLFKDGTFKEYWKKS